MKTQHPEALIPDEKTVMAQAQVYASTWAIVGSRFDAGDGLELAEQEKTILADMVRRLGARITELESQLAQRFDAADMATAAAQGFRDGGASLTAQAADSQPAQVMGDTPPPCDQELFDQGVSVGLFDIPKWTAEALCRGIAAATEARVDWHYIGGRVHIKALPAARAPADSVQEDAARESEYRRGYRHGYEQRDAEVRGAMA